jgi:hypothetical protein
MGHSVLQRIYDQASNELLLLNNFVINFYGFSPHA